MKKKFLSAVPFFAMGLCLSVGAMSPMPNAAFAAGTSYAITNGTPKSAEETNHGYIAIDKTTAAEGETVTITVEPDEGYQLKSLTATPVAPTIAGALKGVFSIGATKKVQFSQGNLYYNGSKFDFEANQYEYHGYDSANNTWGLFGWVGASSTVFTSSPEIYGVSTSITKTDYGNSNTDALKADWGEAIDDKGTWSTLSKAEWQYLFNTSARMVNGKDCYSNAMSGITIGGSTYRGVFLYPNDYNGEVVSSSMTWNDINAAGIVFLPAAGYRYSSDVYDVGSAGFYRSSTVYDNDEAYHVFFESGRVLPGTVETRRYGGSVRLVTSVPADLETITPEKQEDGTYQFTMPAYATTVTAEFEADPAYAITNFDFTTNLYGHKGVSSGSGSEYVADGDIAVGEKFTEEPTQIEFTVNGNTQTRFWDASSKHELRLYKGATFVLSVVGNYKIIKVAFTGSAVNLDANGTTVSDKVWEGNATKLITFVNTATTSKINSIKVTCIAVDPSAEIPTITPNEEASVYWKPITVTLGCITEGAAIHYTLDGSDPTTESAVYSEPISISATTTVKAMAVKEGLGNSEVVSKTFTFGTIFASLEELVEKQPATDEVTYIKVTITNAVINDFYVSSKGYTNGIYVTAANTTVELYCNDVPQTWEVGGKVSGTIQGEWTLYKGVSELQKWEGGWDVLTYTAPVSWPEDAPTEAPVAPTHDGTSLLGAPLTTNLDFEPLDWPGSKPEKLTFETGETIYYMEKMNWQIYTNWAEDSYDMSEYDMLHVDLFPASGTQIKVEIEGLRIDDGGQGYKNYVIKTLTAGEWNSLDIALSEFPALNNGDTYDFSDVRYFILEGYNAEETALSVGNVYFYKAPHEHAIKTTHARVEATCEEAGHEVYYECSCGKYFSNQELTTEIEDLETWLGENGDGYIAPIDHDIDIVLGTPATEGADGFKNAYKCNNCGKYYEDADRTKLIGDEAAYNAWKLAEGKINKLDHDMVIVGGNPATYRTDGFKYAYKCNNCGKYFEDKAGTKLIGDEAAYNAWKLAEGKIPALNPQKENGLSGGAIAGIVIGSVFGLLIIAFVVLYILWKRKNLNIPLLCIVLTPAFRFINKLFFKTKLNDVEAKEAENKAMKE